MWRQRQPVKQTGLPGWRGNLERDGFAIVEQAINLETVSLLIDAIERTKLTVERKRRGAVYARRNLLSVPAVRELAASDAVRRLVSPVLGEGCLPVRGLFFDKTAEANWRVPWHQDLSIAVRDRREVAGFGPWSVKAGVPHVQPPREMLDRMLTVRVHLDDCHMENGPLRVLPGSHTHGVLTADRVQEFRSASPEVVCEVPIGGAFLMRPLLVHASSPALWAGHRRVVHLEYAAGGLPGGLEWYEEQFSG